MKSKKILIIEDEEAISDLISYYLEKEGFITKAAGCGEKGLCLVREFMPDLVLLDLMLPDMDGFEVCKKISADYIIPIIMLTAKSDTIDKILGMELGADDYITKPFEIREVIVRIKSIFRRIELISEAADTDAGDLKKYDTFSGCKAMYEDASFWTDKGTVTSDGKTLKKILCGNEQEGNTTCVYIDEATGFPAKEESYEKGKLISTMTYEFKYADRDEKLFDASGEGVKLEQLDMNKMSEKLKKITEKNKVD